MTNGIENQLDQFVMLNGTAEEADKSIVKDMLMNIGLYDIRVEAALQAMYK